MTGQPDIFIAGIRIQEPVITVTSFLVAAFGIVGYYRTRHSAGSQSIFLYRLFILFIGISCLLSGFFGHAFNYNFGGVKGKFPSWLLSMFAVAFAAQAALMRVKQYIGKTRYVLLTYFNWLELVVFIVLTLVYQEFYVVEIHTAIGLLLIVFVLEIFIYSKIKSRISLNVVAGISMLILAVLFHIFKISFTYWFTYFDFGHVFMAMCLFFFWMSILRYNAAEQELFVNAIR